MQTSNCCLDITFCVNKFKVYVYVRASMCGFPTAFCEIQYGRSPSLQIVRFFFYTQIRATDFFPDALQAMHLLFEQLCS